MDKTSFKPDTRYVFVLKDGHGTPRPANLYVYRVYDKFMVARSTSGDGLVRKVRYEDVVSIVEEKAVASAERYFLPAAILDENTWRDRDSMQHYASAPGRGK